MSKKRKFSVLPWARIVAMTLVTLVLVVAGVWASWGTAQHVLLSKGREHGVLTVTGCGAEICTGRFDPDGPAGVRTDLTIDRSVAVVKGESYPVVVKPGTRETVRAGWAGGLHAWLPLGGALLLAAPVLAGGLRLTRAAWISALSGAALLVGTFLIV
ncbi:hypothetical protein NX801_19655 [Streptomyces sp. LP05-1]|uniref:Integral membrane protein n=1 Tax=Streptomyces pyxinae TaxID=2970734 RepID=A0ABT2CK94_9ACTN|nr:hypothetical protein [Streptomyces sp. LP05-1]MCS0637838.1 hypothetical protein [Streptomyces sp. LP05-1]